MTEIDIELAKQEIGPLLDRVSHGEQVTITEEGRAVVQVSPVGIRKAVRSPERQRQIRDAVARLEAIRSSIEPFDISWPEIKKFRDFGRPGCE